MLDASCADPLADPHGHPAGDATTRIVYDLIAYRRTPDPSRKPQPAVVSTLARETHDSRPGCRRADRRSSTASPTPTASAARSRRRSRPSRAGAQRDADDHLADGQPDDADVSPRWVGSGWTIFNNKGKPVRQYEPFFTDTHRFEFDVRIGVSPVLFYDPVERVVATLHPNHT